MKTIKINRRRWLRGGGNGTTALWVASKRRGCCLGHAVKQICNLTWNDLDNIGMPDALSAEYFNEFKANTNYTFLSHLEEIARINDTGTINDSDREQKLIELFSDYLKLKLEFYGEYVKS